MLLRYLAGLPLSKQILWCYLVWYLVMIGLHFDPNPTMWLSSLGLSAVVGLALLLGLGDGPRDWTRLERWQIFRLFFIPFCVSSYAATCKGQGFVAVFSPLPAENLFAGGACLAFAAIAWGARRLVRPARIAS
jgi:hypothetical protein